MKLSRSTLSLALLAALAAPAAHAEIAIDNIADSEVSFEGLVQADSNWFDNDVKDLNGASGNDGKDSEFEMRRAELVLKGKGPGNIEWVLGYDAKANKYLDVNVRYKLGGNSNNFIQAGQFKQPNSLEELSSTKSNDFISKAMVTNTFAIARRLGVGAGYGDSNWGVNASAFGRELTKNLAHGSGYGARGYWAPLNDKGSILHLGLSYVDYDTDADTLRYRARPDADLATERLIDTGSLTDTDRVGTLGFESFWVHGPFKLQGEYMSSSVQRYGAASEDFTGTAGYVSGLWNVTGETWGYKGGTPATPLPDEPGRGMWQVGLRYDTMDLNDNDVLGGKMDTWTAGVNWYWRSNFKFALNYVKVDSSKAGIDDNPNIVEGRMQFYW
ncbi:MAG: OprO/OprP family phosphate-selective porin [Luteimonas sp.]